MKNIKEKLKNFKVLFLDADGVFFDGYEMRSILKSGEAIILKRRTHLDGQGLSFLRELGIRLVFVTGEGEPLPNIVDKFNNLRSAKEGRWNPVEIFSNTTAHGQKLEIVTAWLSKNKLSFSDSAYIGDDVNDLPPMREIQKEGITIAPANVTRKVRQYADIVTKNSGGNGAIREFAEMILDARGIDETTLPPA